MRALSKTEKKIIDHIIPKGNTIKGLLGGIIEELVLKIYKDENKVETIIKNHESGQLVDKDGLDDFYTQRIYYITTLMKLLMYLENTGYIVTYSIWDASERTKFIGDTDLVAQIKSGECKTLTYEIQDEYLIASLIRYCESFIVSTEALRDFVSMGYRTPEQIRFRKSYYLTTAAIAISFIIGIGSLLLSIKNSSLPIQIDVKQLNTITNRLDSINSSLRLLNVKPDTINR